MHVLETIFSGDSAIATIQKSGLYIPSLGPGGSIPQTQARERAPSPPSQSTHAMLWLYQYIWMGLSFLFVRLLLLLLFCSALLCSVVTAQEWSTSERVMTADFAQEYDLVLSAELRLSVNHTS